MNINRGGDTKRRGERIRGMRKPKDDEGRGVKHGAVALVLGITFGSKGVGEGLLALERIEGRTNGRTGAKWGRGFESEFRGSSCYGTFAATGAAYKPQLRQFLAVLWGF
ncbi:hypothetical protein HZH66_000251 [Vespula vulgaris]|uniref:Uncharacterized protein n=2 Tax=Vespula TaxID=7451 RepID=A0A834KRV2_VESVU|nr:hypothetical protein HZH66_000251 [Vespula vulgaris]